MSKEPFIAKISQICLSLPLLGGVIRLYYRFMAWYLDGPRCYPRRLVGHRYRSPALATFWWFLGWGTRLFSLPILLVLPVANLFLLHSIMQPNAKVRVLILIMLSLLLTDFILGCVFWPVLKIKRLLPARACVGQPFRIEYQLENRRRLPALCLELDYGMSAHYFRRLQAPIIKILAGREKRSVEGVFIAKQRGKYFLAQTSGISDFPFSVCRHSSIKKTSEYLLVHPAWHSLRDLRLPSGIRLQKSGLEQVMRVSEAMEFQGCRDYREGDNPRHIHWRSSARRGDLVVREFQEEYLSRTALIVDTCLKHPPKHSCLFRGVKRIVDFFKGKGGLMASGVVPELEAGLSLAAAIAEFLIKEECLIDLFAAGRVVRHLQAGRQVAPLQALLDTLAEIEAETNSSLDKLAEEIFEEVEALGNAIIILLGYDKERRDFITSLRERGVAVKLLLIGEEWPDMGDATLLPAEQIMAGKVVNL